MELSQQLVAIGLVLTLLATGLWAARRRGLIRLNFPTVRGRTERKLELIDRLALTPQHGIHFIRADGRLLLIATYPGGIECLDSDVHRNAPDERLAAIAGARSESGRRAGLGAGA
jgi:flagellar biogenesis protein FliO